MTHCFSSFVSKKWRKNVILLYIRGLIYEIRLYLLFKILNTWLWNVAKIKFRHSFISEIFHIFLRTSTYLTDILFDACPNFYLLITIHLYVLKGITVQNVLSSLRICVSNDDSLKEVCKSIQLSKKTHNIFSWNRAKNCPNGFSF